MLRNDVANEQWVIVSKVAIQNGPMKCLAVVMYQEESYCWVVDGVDDPNLMIFLQWMHVCGVPMYFSWKNVQPYFPDAIDVTVAWRQPIREQFWASAGIFFTTSQHFLVEGLVQVCLMITQRF